MKFDSLTIAAVVFVVGLLISVAGSSEWFDGGEPVPSELQRGFQVTNAP